MPDISDFPRKKCDTLLRSHKVNVPVLCIISNIIHINETYSVLFGQDWANKILYLFYLAILYVEINGVIFSLYINFFYIYNITYKAV